MIFVGQSSGCSKASSGNTEYFSIQGREFLDKGSILVAANSSGTNYQTYHANFAEVVGLFANLKGIWPNDKVDGLSDFQNAIDMWVLTNDIWGRRMISRGYEYPTNTQSEVIAKARTRYPDIKQDGSIDDVIAQYLASASLDFAAGREKLQRALNK